MSLQQRLTVGVTALVSVPLALLVLVAFSRGSLEAVELWGWVLMFGAVALCIGLVGIGSLVWIRGMLQPFEELHAWLRRGAQQRDKPGLPSELERIRTVVTGVLTSQQRRAGDRSLYVATLIHDMRTPLLAVSRSLEYALESDDPRETRRWLQPAHTELLRLVASVQDIIDVDRIERDAFAPELAEVDLNALATRAGERIQRSRPDVVLDVKRGRVSLQRADERLLTRALENVIGNALRVARSRVDVEVLPGLVRVVDDGPGMSVDALEAFAATPGSRSGRRAAGGERHAGLGLFIARTILEAHGGQLSIEASSESGSVVLMYVGVPRGGT